MISKIHFPSDLTHLLGIFACFWIINLSEETTVMKGSLHVFSWDRKVEDQTGKSVSDVKLILGIAQVFFVFFFFPGGGGSLVNVEFHPLPPYSLYDVLKNVYN